MKITINNIESVFKSKKCSVESAELKGFILIENLFCDSSGCGALDEPALTSNQLILKLKEILDDHPEVHTFITDQGQFQVYVGVFKKGGKRQVVKVANNTTKRYEGDDLIIRLHDTDILKFSGKSIVLNSGGYHTRTTKERINHFLPPGFYVYQKDYEWFLKTPDAKYDFKDGLEVYNSAYAVGQEVS